MPGRTSRRRLWVRLQGPAAHSRRTCAWGFGCADAGAEAEGRRRCISSFAFRATPRRFTAPPHAHEHEPHARCGIQLAHRRPHRCGDAGVQTSCMRAACSGPRRSPLRRSATAGGARIVRSADLSSGPIAFYRCVMTPREQMLLEARHAAPRSGARGPRLPGPPSPPLAYKRACSHARSVSPSLCRTTHHAPRTATIIPCACGHVIALGTASAQMSAAQLALLTHTQESAVHTRGVARCASRNAVRCADPSARPRTHAEKTPTQRNRRRRRRRSMGADALPFPSQHAGPRDQPAHRALCSN